LWVAYNTFRHPQFSGFYHRTVQQHRARLRWQAVHCMSPEGGKGESLNAIFIRVKMTDSWASEARLGSH